MVVRKQILVLANSVKKAGRCIAGREIVSDGKQYQLGGWLRPVTDHGEGEVRDHERAYGDNSLAEVMDFAEVPLRGQVGDLCQPENWHIAGATRWSNLNAGFQRPTTEYLVERPRNLWLQPGEKTDRVTHEYLAAHPPEQSLYIVRPESFRLSLWSTTWDGRVRRKRRCVFTYRGNEYDIGLTDPVVTGRYEDQIPAAGRPPVEIRLPCCDNVAVCVSLAGAFQGCHYKVVATVFEGA
jgi:hypothetical protein